MPNLQSGRQQRLHMYNEVLLHVRFSALCVWVWLSIITNLDFHMIFCTSFIDSFFLGIFIFNRKFVHWYSHLVATSGLPTISQSSCPTIAAVNTRITNTQNTNIEVVEVPNLIGMVCQAMFRPYTESRVMATASASDTIAVEPRILEWICQPTFAIYGVIDFLPSNRSIFLFQNFSTKAMHAPNDMVIAYATGLPAPLMTAPLILYHQSSLRTPKSLSHFLSSDKHSAEFEAKYSIALSKALQAMHDNIHNINGAVR